MEQQLSLRIPAALATRLKRISSRLERTRSEVVRLALEQFLDREAATPRGRPIDLVRDLIGSIESGLPDVGQRHREYLLRRLRRGR
jgi:hypothetical protein